MAGASFAWKNAWAGRRLRVLSLVGIALALSIYAWWPILAAYPHTQAWDGPLSQKMFEAARISVVRYHEWPFYNPYECGGLALWDNPESGAGAPLVWLMFIVGSTAMMMIWYVVHSAAGFLCMWVFTRVELRVSKAAAFVASAAWAFSGFHQQHYNGGHFLFVPFLYFPLAIALWRWAETRARAAIGLGLLVAWMVYEGSTYPLPHLLLLLGAETLTRAWPPRRLVAIVRGAVVVGVVAFTVSASRLLPVMDQLHAHTRPLGTETDALQWATLRDMFLARVHERRAIGQEYVWPEFGAYIGPLLLGLAFVGLLTTGASNAVLVALLVFFFCLLLGHQGAYAPWHILKAHVYPFKEMRVPSRFRVEVLLFLSAFIALAIDKVPELARRLRFPEAPKLARAAVLTVGLIGLGDMMGVGQELFETTFTNPPLSPVARTPHLYYGGPDIAPYLLDQPRQNRGRLQCWNEWGFSAGAPLWEGDLPQARAAEDGIVVDNVSRTQNTFTIDVTAAHEGRVLVNTGYDKQFHTDVGTLSEVNRQLVLTVPAGHNQVHIAYRPRLFGIGLLLTVVGLSGAIAFFVARRRRRARAPEGERLSGLRAWVWA